ncbi:MAG: DUF2585 domain-containing protein [Sphingomonadaceae bacterium]
MRRRTLMLIVAIVVGAAAILLAMGRPPICTCGMVKLWEGAVNSAGNSQHIADWYSFSHIIHGFIFYALTWWLLRSWLKTDTRLALSVLIEAGWELLENSPLIIDRYRTATLAFGYSGDSVLNSMSDIAMMAAGFLFALKMPARVTVAVAIGFELMTLYTIRDNLTLNVLMLTWPIEAVKTWQAGG